MTSWSSPARTRSRSASRPPRSIARLTDDGVGATRLNAGPGHLGMATMRARAEADGGRLDVTSAPGAGTTVVLTLPTAPAGYHAHHRSGDDPRIATPAAR